MKQRSQYPFIVADLLKVTFCRVMIERANVSFGHQSISFKAIGGTWGCATSNVGKWEPEYDWKISYDGFYTILDNIAQTSELLSRYVHKYFYDMIQHSKEIFKVVKPGGFIHYIVGNSKFYDVMLPVECIFASIFASVGFVNVNIRTIRKRTSKKELFEFIVSAQKPN